MVKAMTLREVERALVDHDCTYREGKGDHRKWCCPCGKHQTVVPRARIVSPGVVRSAVQRMACLPEGWLQ